MIVAGFVILESTFRYISWHNSPLYIARAVLHNLCSFSHNKIIFCIKAQTILYCIFQIVALKNKIFIFVLHSSSSYRVDLHPTLSLMNHLSYQTIAGENSQ